MKIFLSYSSRDKSVVKRINDDLKSHHHDTWMADENILPGRKIVDNIQKHLTESDVLILFLSHYSIASPWVQQEWHTKLHENAEIIPLLLDNCAIPTFLRDVKPIDFTEKENYEHNLSLLLQSLNGLKTNNDNVNIPEKDTANYTIFTYTKEMLEELDKEYIALPVQSKISFVETLKKIPRSGKLLRSYNFNDTIKVRSVYDHILSVAHLADCIIPHSKLGILRQDYADLARLIAFHELTEVVLGDIPIYTPLTPTKRIESKNFAEERLRSVEPKKRRQIASDFIWLFLDDVHRKSLETVNTTLSDVKSKIYIAFKVCDKFDPIIAIWRYLHHYRFKLGKDPKQFNHDMKDFYENPDLKNFLQANKIDYSLIEMANFLQDRSNAWDYYFDCNKPFHRNNLYNFPADVIRNSIEGIALFCE